MTHQTWHLVQCDRCALVYLNPRPTPEAIAENYDWFAHAPLQTGARRAEEGSLRRVLRGMRGKGILRRKTRETVVAGRISQFVTGGRFLDVGCGDGFMVEAMRDLGFAADGVDISPWAVREAHRLGRTTVQRGHIHDVPLDKDGYDAVLLMSYLEHEPFPTRALKRVREVLRPGGHLFIKVPHYGSWNRRVLGAAWSGYFFPQHLYYFTPDTAARLLAKCGFETVRNRFMDHVPLSDVFWVTAQRPQVAVKAPAVPQPSGAEAPRRTQMT